MKKNFVKKYPLDELVKNKEKTEEQKEKTISGGLSWIRETTNLQEIIEFIKTNSDIAIKKMEIIAIEKKDVNVMEKIIMVKKTIQTENLKKIVEAYQLGVQDEFIKNLSLEQKIELKKIFEYRAKNGEKTNKDFSKKVLETNIFALLKDDLSNEQER